MTFPLKIFMIKIFIYIILFYYYLLLFIIFYFLSSTIDTKCDYYLLYNVYTNIYDYRLLMIYYKTKMCTRIRIYSYTRERENKLIIRYDEISTAHFSHNK